MIHHHAKIDPESALYGGINRRVGVKGLASVVLVILMLFIYEPMAQAALVVLTSAYCTSNTLGRCATPETRDETNDGLTPLQNGEALTAYTSNATHGIESEAYASANYGVLRVSGHAESSGDLLGSVVNIASGESEAAWTDFITINSANFARDTEAVMSVLFQIGGGFTRNGELSQVNPGAYDSYTAETIAGWNITLNNTYANAGTDAVTFPTGGYEYSEIDGDSAATILNSFYYSAPILLGEDFKIEMDIFGTASALASGQYTRAWSDFDLAHSAYWGGIASVTVGGQTISYDLTSHSGHDWTQSSIPVEGPTAVPEPSCIWLIGSGILGWVGTTRRKSVR